MSNKWEELLISEDVILRANELAEKEKRPKMIDQEMIFEYAPGIPVVDYVDINQNNEDQGEIDIPEQNENNDEEREESNNESENEDREENIIENNNEEREENNNENIQEENENFNDNEIDNIGIEEGPDDVLELNVIPNETSSDEEEGVSVGEDTQQLEDFSRGENQNNINFIDDIGQVDDDPLEENNKEERLMYNDGLENAETGHEDVVDTERDESDRDINMGRPRRNVSTSEEYLKRRFDKFSGMQRGAHKLAAQHLMQETFAKDIEEEANKAHEESRNFSLMQRCVKAVFAQK